MATVTADLAAEQTEDPSIPVPDPQHKRKRRTFTMSEEAYNTLSMSAEAFGTNRSRLIEQLVFRCGAILTWQAPEPPPPPIPWWKFWRRNGGATSSQILSPVLELPASSASLISQE